MSTRQKSSKRTRRDRSAHSRGPKAPSVMQPPGFVVGRPVHVAPMVVGMLGLPFGIATTIYNAVAPSSPHAAFGLQPTTPWIVLCASSALLVSSFSLSLPQARRNELQVKISNGEPSIGSVAVLIAAYGLASTLAYLLPVSARWAWSIPAVALGIALGRLLRNVPEIGGGRWLVIHENELRITSAFLMPARRIALSAISSMEMEDSTMHLTLSHGERVEARLPALTPEVAVRLRDELVAMTPRPRGEKRIRERPERAPEIPDLAGERYASLEGQGRSFEVWREALTALGSAGTNYRGDSLSRDDLLRAIDHPATPPERRIGAAIALSAGRDETLRTRIEVAATANPDATDGRALLRVADGHVDEDDLARALVRD